jgi:serine/threonine protein kinase
MTQQYTTAISTVIIDGPIVKKTYTIEDDSISDDTVYGYLTTEAFILNLLDGISGFPTLQNIIMDSPKYTLVMNYLGTTLHKTDHPIDVFIQILQRVADLHAHHIVHCDLKPDNIVIDTNGHVSIIDFSHSLLTSKFTLKKDVYGSHRIDTDAPDMIYGARVGCTYAYTSPESYNRDIVKTSSHDIWSLGCILYELVSGESLFERSTDLKEITHQHQQKDIIQHKVAQITDLTIQHIITNMLNYESHQRPSVIQLLDQLGVHYTPRKIFDMSMTLDTYYPTDYLRLAKFPWSMCYFVDTLYEHICYKLATQSMSQKIEQPYEYDSQYDKLDPPKKYGRYEIATILHFIIGNVFNYSVFAPMDVLSYGRDYVELLWTILKCYKVSLMFN